MYMRCVRCVCVTCVTSQPDWVVNLHKSFLATIQFDKGRCQNSISVAPGFHIVSQKAIT